MRGGNANNGVNAGFAYWNTNNAASNANANISSQLSYKKLSPGTVPLGKKQQIKTTVLVIVGGESSVTR